MLEIVFVIFLAKKLAAIAEAKRRSKGWAALGPVFWIVGEVAGAAVAAIIGMEELAVYGGALAGAAVGAGFAWLIVNGLSANEAYAGVDDRIVGGHYDPANPYNAPGTSAQANPYSAAPPRDDR